MDDFARNLFYHMHWHAALGVTNYVLYVNARSTEILTHSYIMVRNNTMTRSESCVLGLACPNSLTCFFLRLRLQDNGLCQLSVPLQEKKNPFLSCFATGKCTDI
jgi:hypothetical protein